LGIGEQANDIKVVLSDEVVPVNRESFDWTGAEAGDVAHLANERRADAGHAFDGQKRSQCGIEEPLGQLLAAQSRRPLQLPHQHRTQTSGRPAPLTFSVPTPI
jgi:hypothetical protein